MYRPTGFIIATGVLACLGTAVPWARAADVDYRKQVKPILEARCYACHGALKQKGKLRLDTAALAFKGGSSGPAIAKGEPAKSELLLRVTAKEPGDRMPPEHEGSPLSPAQIDILRDWIRAGAPHPADEQPEADPRNHWAFRAVTRPPVPEVGGHSRLRNPVDAFVARRYDERGLTPVTEASRAVLLRRLSLDLVGLPPTLEEIAAFESDRRPDWYERAVNRLLDDPRHGERWARHWMDIWRYSDWWGLGNELRNSQKHIHHWRDWIIESVNQDAPYDEMVRQMLAADELYPNDLGKLRATGFLARNYFLFNRHQWMDETVEHVSKGFLGLTMNCVRCHDHKYDPFPQLSYYRLRAFFEPYHARLDVLPGENDLERDGLPRVFDARLDDPTYRFIRGDEKNPDRSRTVAPGVPDLLSPDLPEIRAVDLPAEAWQPQRRAWVVSAHLDAARRKLAAAEGERAAASEGLARARAAAAKKAEPEKPLAAGAGTKQGEPVVAETFENLDPKRWRSFGGEWKQGPKRLEQKRNGAERAVLRLLAEAPRDFDATLRFTLLGGSMWRSVGLGFDVADGDPTKDGVATYHEQNVYVSGYAGGPKIQVSYNDAGKWHYPTGAMRSLPITTNREYTLRLRVRDRLVNASIDGEFLLAFALPLARRGGAVQLFTFDALAAFHEFRLEALDPKAVLRPPTSANAGPDPETARANLRVAEAAEAVARAEVTAVESRAKAWRAVWDEAGETRTRETHAAAVRADRLLEVARAKHTLALAERGSKGKGPGAGAVPSAREALARAEKAVGAEIKPAEKIPEFAGARWTPTRFRSSGANDPAPGFPSRSTGRRTALAKWITDKRNPLPARVAVNHIWNRHFGTPLVPTVFDFGRKGQSPTHPDLLDWLACEFVESGWSMKHLHRLIVQSATYRLSPSSGASGRNAAKDPDNVYLWRRTPVRLESQAVRDSLLSLADSLDRRMGGPPVQAAGQADSRRRSIYFFHSNNERNQFLTTFDEALVTDCYRRDQSIVPQQALAMTNSRLVLDQSRPIAERISMYLESSGRPAGDEAFVRSAFQLLLAGEPGAEELAACLRSLAEWRKLPEAGTGPAATNYSRANLVWVLLNHTDFITIR
ncbi:MAG: PSD1 and planctomycete cytochrome C domain-containing protein [Gemmataceae bacterium]